MTVDEMTRNRIDLHALCADVRKYNLKGEDGKCRQMIFSAMEQFPHAPEPHNLIGILLEKEGKHAAAMKHFRAAWALDPTYLPARQNLENFGTFFSTAGPAYDESDCPDEKQGEYAVKYDAGGIGHLVRRN